MNRGVGSVDLPSADRALPHPLWAHERSVVPGGKWHIVPVPLDTRYQLGHFGLQAALVPRVSLKSSGAASRQRRWSAYITFGPRFDRDESAAEGLAN